jgi:sigma-B regulation protein RsbU (phosphoserine phosphatase)
VVASLDRADDLSATIHTVIETIIAKFKDELGIYGGRLYERQGVFYELADTFGDAKKVPPGLQVPRSYPPVELVLEQGTVYMDATDPRLDKSFEAVLGVDEFAAIEVGDEDYILAFNLTGGHDRDDVLFSLGILRHSVNQKIRRERMEGIFEEARKIQVSILPRRAPVYGDYDIYGRSVPMDNVGGDYFDYIPLTEKILGLAIADVSGHGLPAALQVRDIYMGLRMGLARDFKIVRTVERMNRIIHRSTLTSRFVSMFYGELELNGVFIYVNAGHPAPFHLAADGAARSMEEGGPVLGPLSEATYERGFVVMKPGDLLVFYTDGIIEAMGRGTDATVVLDPASAASATHAAGAAAVPDPAPLEEYGVDRLLAVAREHRAKPARAVVEAIFASVEAFTQGAPAEDDRTVVVVTYPAGERVTTAFPRPQLTKA